MNGFGKEFLLSVFLLVFLANFLAQLPFPVTLQIFVTGLDRAPDGRDIVLFITVS